LLKDKSKRV